MATFKWRHRRLPANCAANVPLIDEMVRLFEAAAIPADAGAPAGAKSKMQRAYASAIESLAKYPLEITSAVEAEQLHGIGSFLAARIGRILSEKLGISPSVAALPILPAPAVPVPAVKKPRKPTASSESAGVSSSAAAASAAAAAQSLPRVAVAAAAVPSVPPTLPPMPSIFSPGTLAAAIHSAFSPPRRSPSSPVISVSPELLQTSRSLSAFLPECPFGELCYRTNVQHFLEQTHPRRHERAVAITAEGREERKERVNEQARAEERKHSSPNKRAREEICLLSEGEGSQSPPPAAAAAPPPTKKPRAAPVAAKAPAPIKKKKMKRSLDEDDFMSDDDGKAGQSAEEEEDEDDDDDIVDLTSPRIVAASRSASVPPAAASSFSHPAASAASSSARPPSHPAAASAAAVWSLPQAPAAAATKKASKSVAAGDGEKASKLYKPKVGSTAHAILLALYHASGPLSKSALLSAALAYYPPDKRSGLSESSVLSTLSGGLPILITRDLANKSLTPVQYEITKLGRQTVQAMTGGEVVAITVAAADSQDSFLSSPSPQISPSVSRVNTSPAPNAAAAAAASSSISRPNSSPPPVAADVALARRMCDAAEFEVVLLIDVRERSGRKDAAYMIDKLSKRGLSCDARALSVGDFMYIARHRVHKATEIVLDVIVERKRVSDLIASIRDGRYHEQRSRLKKTALRRMIYVIEGIVSQDTVHGLPLKTVESVLSSMNGVHGLLVHHTPSIEPTISFIETLYHLLEGELKAKGVPVVLPESSAFRPFQPSQALPNFAELPSTPSSLHGTGESFTSFSSRLDKSANLLAAELFGTQLRMIRGVSSGLAMNIIALYPSVRALCDAYDRCPSEEAEENMLEAISTGPFRRPAGKAMSFKIRTFFRKVDYE